MNPRLLIFLVIFFMGEMASAQSHYHFYQAIRQQAMGGAAIGVVDDETALILNPAALGRLRDLYLTLADPVLEIGSNNDQIVSGSANTLKNNDPQVALNNGNANAGLNFHAMGEVFPSIVFPNFGIGFLGRYAQDSMVNTAKTAFNFQYHNDYAIVTGFNVRIWDGIIKIGANARLINRAEISNSNIDPTSTTLDFNTMLTEGVGLGSDVGMILTAPITYLPSLSAVVRDIGRTAYTVRGGLLHSTANTPYSTPQTLNAAFTFSPILSNTVRSMWTLEYEDVLDAYQDTIAQRHYHGGVEFNVGDFFFIRGGYNQGYWTGGIELAIENYQIQFTSYGEEIGTGSTTQEDRRYMGGFAIRF